MPVCYLLIPLLAGVCIGQGFQGDIPWPDRLAWHKWVSLVVNPSDKEADTASRILKYPSRRPLSPAHPIESPAPFVSRSVLDTSSGRVKLGLSVKVSCSAAEIAALSPQLGAQARHKSLRFLFRVFTAARGQNLVNKNCTGRAL